ncbi:hypothetical protein DR864_18310 [Runella rosea]|uniref:Uncharacterized protein n=1 Tax=Runella rosea TaxID=2259595 RepID=A0A344TLN0_9BACT|nr:hypothetical protein [Runella rosea]AXE19551.1 hypothetical protein DR864_18310 [Runella rosea]
MNRVMNFPERSLEVTSAFRQKWFWMWALLPIAAYYASWLMMTVPFPLFLVIAQWWALDHNKWKENPKIWLWNFVIFVLTGLVLVMLLDHLTISEDYTLFVVIFFVIYYGIQTLNEFLLVKVFMKWRFGFWSVANLLAALFWIGILLFGKAVIDNQIKFEYLLWIIIPIMGFISNIITGLGIHLATQSRYGV